MLAEWLLTGSVTQLVLAIISKDTRIPLERWVFDIKLVEPPAESTEAYCCPRAKFPELTWFTQAASQAGSGDPVGNPSYFETDHIHGHLPSGDP